MSALVVVVLAAACADAGAQGLPYGEIGTGVGASPAAAAGKADFGLAGPLPLLPEPFPDSAPAQICQDGRCATSTVSAAREQGMTVIDLGDTWAPRVFGNAVDPTGKRYDNTYRSEFTKHAADPQTWLEVFGIPPSLSNVRTRWREALKRTCYADVDWEALRTYEGRISLNRKDARVWVRKVKKKRPAPKAVRVHQVLVAAQRRMKCDGLYHDMKLREGWADGRAKKALLRFNKRHRIFSYGTRIAGRSLELLAKDPDGTHHDMLLRALTERVGEAAGELEDGSGKGTEDRMTAAMMAFVQAVGADTPAGARSWLDGLGELSGATYVAARLPPPPADYGGHMALEIVVDRGDVWYDSPYDPTGAKRKRKIRRRPKVTLWAGEGRSRRRIVTWRTTIGGWRKEELGDGHTYLKYKPSPIGDSVMKRIAAGPVWVPPESTPARSIVRWVKGEGLVPNYREMGPGPKSAYGLVAGYLLHCGKGRKFNKCLGKERGIRIHGTSSWLSVLGAHSHGCHRLFNHLAVRLYGFILAHRTHGISGQIAMDYERTIELRPPGKPDAKPKEVEVKLTTRGFRYELSPPLRVVVKPGRIRGELEEPDEDYIRIPSKEYTEAAWVPEEGGAGEPPLSEAEAP